MSLVVAEPLVRGLHLLAEADVVRDERVDDDALFREEVDQERVIRCAGHAVPAPLVRADELDTAMVDVEVGIELDLLPGLDSTTTRPSAATASSAERNARVDPTASITYGVPRCSVHSATHASSSR